MKIFRNLHHGNLEGAHHGAEKAEAGRIRPRSAEKTMHEITAAPKNREDVELADLIVPGMGSDHCAGLVSTSLKRLPGVTEVTTNVATHRVSVHHDPSRVESADLERAIERAGYEVDRTDPGQESGVREVRLTVPGMGSDHCAGIISSSIARLPGILDVAANIGNHGVTVRYLSGGARQGAGQPGDQAPHHHGREIRLGLARRQ
jgi:copper ion binding protein